MKRNLKELEERIGYTFQDFALLKTGDESQFLCE